MHRSRLSVLAIFAAAAACSSNNDAEASSILSKDTALVATLEARESPRQQPLPDACGTVAFATQPSAANRTQAGQLARQGYDAELVGHPQEAQSLLSRAHKLDGTDKSAAYHLARTSEAIGDRAGAMTAYCRYLTLAPTTVESAEARQRVAKLTEAETQVAAGIVSTGAPVQPVATVTTRRVTHARPRAERRVAARGTVKQVARTTRSEHVTYSAGTLATEPGDARTPSDAANGATDVETRTDRSVAGGDMVAMSPPTVDQTPTPARTESRGPSRMQTAGIGAIAGAIMGAATGRSVKSAVIGAAAGGVLGTVVGGGTRSTLGRSIRPWNSVAQPMGNRAVRLSSGRLLPSA